MAFFKTTNKMATNGDHPNVQRKEVVTQKRTLELEDLIFLYKEMKEMFQNVGYKEKQVWELIAVLVLYIAGIIPETK